MVSYRHGSVFPLGVGENERCVAPYAVGFWRISQQLVNISAQRGVPHPLLSSCLTGGCDNRPQQRSKPELGLKHQHQHHSLATYIESETEYSYTNCLCYSFGYTGELGYDGPLHDGFLHMTDNMPCPSPMHIRYSSYAYDEFFI